ncbi:tyrosine-type recombinase/integrase [Halosimplex halophilum]|uniref:tyrosine-type recombinase/integrase n=1 Tax=Halosimplex halophilum TaxID=2559572 RepID=UPI00107F2E20|nr:tyrosine-type recombinase/integrase [Halosimplex halophilum]
MAGLDDFQGFGERAERELGKVDRHDPVDRPHVKRFAKRLDGSVAEGTLAEYLKNLRKTAERLDQPIVELSEADFDAHVFELRRNPEYGMGDEPGLSDGTIRNVEFAVRKFLKAVDIEGTEWADDYELTPPPDTKVSPEDMLRSEDISALVDGANNMRDIAMIEFLADTGARLSLLGSLRVGDVDLDGDQATYRPNDQAVGLKGADIANYPIIDAKTPVRTYLRQVHPRPDDDEAAFFHKIPGHGNGAPWDEDGALSPSTIRKQLRKAADNGGVDRPVHPHNFRHSAITRMVREDYTRAQIEHRVHWEVDTDMWETYQHIAAEEHNADIFAHAGVGDADDGVEHERRPCGNCREPLAPHHEYCPRCGEPATQEARNRRDNAVAKLGEGQVDVEEMSRREFRAHLLAAVQANGEIADAHDADSSPSSDST